MTFLDQHKIQVIYFRTFAEVLNIYQHNHDLFFLRSIKMFTAVDDYTIEGMFGIVKCDVQTLASLLFGTVARGPQI